ncbi:hypothetical protein HYT26_04040 [Candidatus Pacearchaeota archaeon]|nr:hypothetical protein [Candidatus Pacearchaeota archaeon]
MAVGTYKAKKFSILDPGHYGYKRPCPEHYIIAQEPLFSRFFKEEYGLSVRDKEEERKIPDEGLNRYSEDKDEEGLTLSDRYKLMYVETFLGKKFKIAEEDKGWAEKIEKEAEEIKKHLERARGKEHKKEGFLEEILHKKAAAILLVFSIGLLTLSVFLRISATGYAVSKGFGAGNYSLAFAILFFIAGIIIFILAKKKKYNYSK